MATPGPRLRFGSFELDASASELRKNGLRIHIEDQPFRILWMLVSRQGGLVTREELKEALWANDTHVDFDRGLNRAVNKARLAIGDSAANPRFIETLSRRGYRFVAPVASIEPADAVRPPAPETALRVRGRWRWGMGLAAVAIAAVALFVWRPGAGTRISSIAVLPLESGSSDPAKFYLSDGITDQLIADLARLPALRVVSRSSVMGYRGTRKKLSEIATELNVEGLIEGSVTQLGNRVRISVRLVQFPGGQTVWSKTHERDVSEVRSLQNEMVRSIAGEIGRTNRPEDARRLARSDRPVDPQLHELFLRGRFLVNEPGRDALERGIAVMEKVVKLDPTNGAAYATEAQAWVSLSSVYLQPVLAMPKARAAARKAVEADPWSDGPRALLGRVHTFYDWDWQAAEEQFHKAIELNPNSSEAYMGLACLRLVQGRNKEAADSGDRATQLDPRSFWAQNNAILVYTFTRRYDEAIQRARRALEWEPGFAVLRSLLGMAHLEKGQLPDGIRELEAAVKSHRIPTTLGFLACGYARVGRKVEAEAILSELEDLSKRQYVCPFEVAVAYGALGRVDDAYAWMQRGVADRADCMIFLRAEPWLREIRRDPRYPALVRSVGFPESGQDR